MAAEGFRRHETFPCRNVCSQNLVPVFRADRNFERILDCNSPFARLFGFEEPEEFLSSSAPGPSFPMPREMVLARSTAAQSASSHVPPEGQGFLLGRAVRVSPGGGFAEEATDTTERRREDLLLKERNSASPCSGDLRGPYGRPGHGRSPQKILDYAAIYMNTEHGAISFADHPGANGTSSGPGVLLTGGSEEDPTYQGTRRPGAGLGKTMVSPTQNLRSRLPTGTSISSPPRWAHSVERPYLRHLPVYCGALPGKRCEGGYLEQFLSWLTALRNAGLYEDARRSSRAAEA